jgi:CheY-like chemotaxis protein
MPYTPGTRLSPDPAALILLVEDDAPTRDLYRSSLISAGFRVIAVSNGVEALRRLEAERPDAVVLDLGLPMLDGRDVRREMASRPEWRDIPVVVVTGTDSGGVTPDVAAILQKPVHGEVIGFAVEQAIRRARRRHPHLVRGATAPKRPSATVLVVDDEISTHRLLSLLLEPKGYRVVTAASADAAIDMLRSVSVDALVLDVRMPRRSGLDVLTFVRGEPAFQHVPVLLLTGATLTPDEEELVTAHRAYVFYKQENLENDFVPFIERLCGPRPSTV